jgi:hypothetical protein
MKITKRLLHLALPLVTAAVVSASAGAQAATDVTLPTAPNAQKAADGGYTAARASLPGDNGSPLEPYLYLAILAGGGIIAAVGVGLSDRRVRALR